MSKDGSVRASILDAALRIMQESGVKELTQPKVAKAAGVRQSHLTYYFPKKIDLVAALLQGHLDQAAPPEADAVDTHHSGDIAGALETIVKDPRRMRFFLGLIVEAQREPTLKTMVDEHMAQFDAMVAAHYGRKAGDEDVEAFLNALRGYGMRALLRDGPAREIDIDGLAKRFRLRVRKQRTRAE